MTQVHMRLKNSSAETGSYDFEAIGQLRIGNGVWEVTTADGIFGWNISQIDRYIIRDDVPSSRADARPEIVQQLHAVRTQRNIACMRLAALADIARKAESPRSGCWEAATVEELIQEASRIPEIIAGLAVAAHAASYPPYRHTDSAGNTGFMADCACGAEFFCTTEGQASELRQYHIQKENAHI